MKLHGSSERIRKNGIHMEIPESIDNITSICSRGNKKNKAPRNQIIVSS